MARLFGLALLAFLPVVMGAAAAPAADLLGRRLGAALSDFVRRSGMDCSFVQIPDPVEISPMAGIPDDEPSEGVAPSPKRSPKRRARQSPPREMQLPGVRVSAAQVLRLANAGVMPSAVVVPGEGKRPLGLALRGVSGLGLGVQDGDVLTHVMGQQVRSVGQVVALVVAARGAGAPTIHGRVWRGQTARHLVVEQPYSAALARRP